MERQGVDFWWLDWQQWTESKFTPGLSNTFWLNFTPSSTTPSVRTPTAALHLPPLGRPGSHRYPLAFSGDTYAKWETLAFLPYFTATSSNVNYGYWGHDIGGHMFKKETKSHRSRTLHPLAAIRRLHPDLQDPLDQGPAHRALPLVLPRPPVRHARRHPPALYAGALRLQRRPRELRHRRRHVPSDVLRPSRTGRGLQRPRAVHVRQRHPRHGRRGSRSTASRGLAARRIWFPEGRWYDCATGAMYEGGRTEELHYTLSENPWYARAGAILPMNPQTVKNLQQPCDTLVLTFIPGADFACPLVTYCWPN